jgi:hypothetical protein
VIRPPLAFPSLAFAQQNGLTGVFVEHLSLTQAAQQSVTKFILIVALNLITAKAAAKF